MELRLKALLDDVAAFLHGHGVAAWLVGGAARDLVRGEIPADLDLAVAGDGYELARDYADARGAAFVAIGAQWAAGRVVIPGTPPLTLDLASLRGRSIEADLRQRDFTVNAIALPLFRVDEGRKAKDERPSSFVDPVGGLADLQAGLLRACGPTSLRDDPLRVLRAARLCASLGLRPDPGLTSLIREAAPGLDKVAPERARDELLKLLDTGSAAPWLRYLDSCGALTRLIPELEPARHCEQPNVHFLPVLAHSLETVAALDWLLPEPLGHGRTDDRRPTPVLSSAEGTDDHASVVPHSSTSLLHAEPADLVALPVAVQTHPDLTRKLPFAERIGELLGEPRAGGHRRAALLKLAALLHDIAKPETKQVYPDGKVSFYEHQVIGAETASRIARRLRLSRQDTAYVALVVREHMRPGQLRAGEIITLRAVNRLFRDLGDAGPDVLLHELADHLATRGPRIDLRGWEAHLAWVGALLEIYYAPAHERREPLVDGHMLMAALNIGPGPAVGALLREIAEAQAAGEVTNREEALALARRLHGH